jgi:beta-glucanase (GH16 family)
MRFVRAFAIGGIFVCALAASTATATATTRALAASVTTEVAVPESATPTPRLVFSDDFTGPLDATSWATVTPWDTRYAAGELEYYDPSDVTCRDGSLCLTSERRDSNGYAFTSGIVTSLPHAKFSYGYFEIRAKLPKGQGIWPAFWLTNDRGLEIDGLEMLGDDPGRIYMTYHEDDSQVYQGIREGSDFSEGFHTYGVDWQPGYIKWYIDGVCQAAYAGSVPSDPMWICLNTTVGGAWPSAPDTTTPFPQTYAIDYVHVYDSMPTTLAPGVPAPVVPENHAPDVVPDSYETTADTGLTVGAPGVLGNDSDSDGDAMSALLTIPPGHGTLALSPDGGFVYTPEPGFLGLDSFAYQASDGSTITPEACVSITVSAPIGPAHDSSDTATVGAPDTPTVSAPATPTPSPSTTPTVGPSPPAVVPVSPATTSSVRVAKPTVKRRKGRSRRVFDISGCAIDAASLASAPSTDSVPGAVHVQFQRLVRGVWVPYRTLSTRRVGRHYSAVVWLPKRSYRVRAVQTGGGLSAPATSGWLPLRVG